MLKQVLPGLAAAMLIAGGATAFAARSDTANEPHQISESFAKARIVGDGYTQVTDLKQSGDGWTAKALESGKPVTLIVTDQGTVDKT